MGKNSKTAGHSGRASQDAAATNLLLPRKLLSKHNSASIRSQENPDCTTPRRPPPCRTCRHSAAAPPYTIRQSETTESGPLVGCLRRHHRDDTTRGGLATPAVGPPRSRRHAEDTARGALPRPPQYSVLRIRFLYRCQDD